MTKPKTAEQKQYKQLFFRFDKGTNRNPPRKTHSGKQWAIWCAWCETDHRYPATLTVERVKAMHADHIEHICRVRAQGEDPFD